MAETAINQQTPQQVQQSLDQSNYDMPGGSKNQFASGQRISFADVEGLLAESLNRFRFKNQKIIAKVLKLLSNANSLSIKLDNIHKEIILENTEMVAKLKLYLEEIVAVNQILSDFTFSQESNNRFGNDYKSPILASRALPNPSETLYVLHGQAYYSYFIKDAPVEDFDELIIFILIQEFIILNSSSRSNEILTLDFSRTPQHLGLLDNLFNKLFLFAQEKGQNSLVSPVVSPKQQIKSQSSQNNPSFDIFILLLYDDNINTNQDLNNNTLTQNYKQSNYNNIKSGFLSLSGMPLQQNLNDTSSNNRFNQSIPPIKYNKLIQRSTQISRLSVKALVEILDSNNDGKITIEDIRKFSHAKFIYFQPNVYEDMFWDITKRRSVAFEEERSHPLGVDEIWTAAQMHYKLGPDHNWIENPRPYRKEWVQLLEAAGQNLPKRHDLPKLKIEGVKDQHQLPIQPTSFKATQIYNSASSITIQNIPKKQYSRPFRAEAGIVVNNTEYIQEVVQDYREQMSGVKEPEAFEKVVNLKFKQVENGEFQTIKFETKNYFGEAERLSKQPALYKHSVKNPIYTFVPENFNFQMGSQQQQDKQQQTTTPAHVTDPTKEQEKKNPKLGIRFSKATSWNIGQLGIQDQESISQLREMGEIDEGDIESLMKTQSIRLSTQRVPDAKTPNRGSLHIPNIKQNQPSAHGGHIRGQTAKYPHNVFDPSFIIRHKPVKRVVTAGEKTRGDQKQIFITTFKQENCPSLKIKLAKNEPITDPYNPVSQVVFREQHTPEKSKPYVTRFKCDPLKNPFGVSEHDSRPREALEREQHKKERANLEEQRKIDEFMGKATKDQDWINYFKLADMDHNFVDQQRPQFLEKGNYIPPSAILNNLLRNNDQPSENFKLFHRTLRACDKNLALGQAPESKF